MVSKKLVISSILPQLCVEVSKVCSLTGLARSLTVTPQVIQTWEGLLQFLCTSQPASLGLRENLSSPGIDSFASQVVNVNSHAHPIWTNASRGSATSPPTPGCHSPSCLPLQPGWRVELASAPGVLYFHVSLFYLYCLLYVYYMPSFG